MLGKENNFSQNKSPKVQKQKPHRPEEQSTPKMISKRIKSVLAFVNPIAKSTSNDTSNRNQVSSHHPQRSKKPIKEPLQEIKPVEEISSRHAEKFIRSSTESFHQAHNLGNKTSRYMATEESEPKRESSVYLRTYMLRSGYNTQRGAIDIRSKSKPKTIQIHISELGSGKGKSKTEKPKVVPKKDPTAKRLFTDEVDLEAEADNLFNSNIDDDDTSINSVPASHQIPNTSRSRTYLLDSDRPLGTWNANDSGSFFSKKPLDDSNKKYRYADVSYSMSDIGSARRRMDFNEVFAKKNAGRELLTNLLSFLDARDTLALMRASKTMHAETKTFMKHLRNIKLVYGLDLKQRKNYWLSVTKAKMMKELYGEPYFTSLLIKSSPAENEIKKDIDRTFLHLKQFKSQNG